MKIRRRGEIIKNSVMAVLRQAVSIRLVMGILSVIVIVFISSLDQLIRIFRELSLLPCGYHTDLVLSALQSDMVISFVPILAVLPLSGSYTVDIKSKFIRLFLIRTSFATYIVSRIIACFLSGGFVIFAGSMLSWITSVLVFLPMERVGEIPWDSARLMLQMQMLSFLCGGFWSVVGMAMSTLMESKYISYATPFVFYYLLVILYERYFSELFIIYPKTWTDPTAWPFGFWGAAIFLLEMTLIFAILFAFRAGRRLQQL